jgi:aarF domain-containing kinase
MSYTFHQVRGWIEYRAWHAGLRTVEIFMDLQARLVLAKAWWRGLLTMGFDGAWRARAGLV